MKPMSLRYFGVVAVLLQSSNCWADEGAGVLGAGLVSVGHIIPSKAEEHTVVRLKDGTGIVVDGVVYKNSTAATTQPQSVKRILKRTALGMLLGPVGRAAMGMQTPADNRPGYNYYSQPMQQVQPSHYSGPHSYSIQGNGYGGATVFQNY